MLTATKARKKTVSAEEASTLFFFLRNSYLSWGRLSLVAPTTGAQRASGNSIPSERWIFVPPGGRPYGLNIQHLVPSKNLAGLPLLYLDSIEYNGFSFYIVLDGTYGCLMVPNWALTTDVALSSDT